MELNTPRDYIEMALRRKWWIIIPFVLVMIGSFEVYKRLPKIYKATTVILVQPRDLPENYVRPTVTLSVSALLPTISQQILSRTLLEKVVRQLGLVEDPSDTKLISKKVDMIRENIEIEVQEEGRRRESTSSFVMSYEDFSSESAAETVNTIGSVFISENLKGREKQALGTIHLLERELSEVEKNLKVKQAAIRRYKEQHMGELPAQQEANLRILERLQRELQANNQSIIAAQQRKANLEVQIQQFKITIAHKPTDELQIQLDAQRTLLQELQTQYTDAHPDVMAAKASVAKLEILVRERERNIAKKPQETTPVFDPNLSALNLQLQEVIDQIDRLRREQAALRYRIAHYQQRIENAPKREEQMSVLMRDNQLLQENYQSLLDKKTQAELAEDLEKGQTEEQFKVLDRAMPPGSPYKPNRQQFFGLAFILGLGFGGMLGLLRDHMDRSFHKAEDVERLLGFPVIATLPRIKAGRATRS